MANLLAQIKDRTNFLFVPECHISAFNAMSTAVQILIIKPD
jgi:hypothetical protein